MPDARFEVVADAGHLPHLDRPDAVAAALVDFLDRRRRERAGRRATR